MALAGLRLPAFIVAIAVASNSLPQLQATALAAGLDERGKAILKQATRFFRQGMYEEAAKMLTDLSVDHPEMASLQRNLGACYYYLRRPEPALSNLRDYLAHVKGNITAEDKAEVQRWIEEMEKLRGQSPAQAAPPTPSADAPPLPPPDATALPPAADTQPASPPSAIALPPAASPPAAPAGLPAPAGAPAAAAPTAPAVETVPASPTAEPGWQVPAPSPTPAPALPSPLPQTADQVQPPAPAPFVLPPPAATAYPPLPTAETAPVNVSAPAQEQSGWPARRIAGTALMGAGIVMVGVGGHFTWRTQDIESSMNSAAQFDLDQYNAGQSAEVLQWVCYGIGAGATITGLILYLTAGSNSSRLSFAPHILPGAAGLAAQGVF